jgi:hypothetical protein
MKMYRGKRVIGLNIPYLMAHDLEIINDTSVLLNENHFRKLQFSDDPKLRLFWDGLKRKHLYESGNWNIFADEGRFTGPNESIEDAYDRIDREYCAKTGRWELFIWDEKQK